MRVLYAIWFVLGVFYFNYSFAESTSALPNTASPKIYSVVKQSGLVKVTRFSVDLPAGDYDVKPLVNENMDVLIHFQGNNESNEWFVDAKNASAWTGDKAQAFSDFHYVKTFSGRVSTELRNLFTASGCIKHNRFCTDIDGADVQVQASSNATNSYSFEILDYSNLLNAINSGFAGDAVSEGNNIFNSEINNSVFEFALKTNWRERFLNSIRSVDTLEKYFNLTKFCSYLPPAYKNALYISGTETSIKHELAIKNATIIAKAYVLGYTNKSMSYEPKEIESLVLNNADENGVFETMSSTFIDESGSRSQDWANELSKYAKQVSSPLARKNLEFHISALEKYGLGSIASDVSKSKAPKVVSKNSKTNKLKPKVIDNKNTGNNNKDVLVADGTEVLGPSVDEGAGEAPQMAEWTAVRTQNGLSLVRFDERAVRMAKEDMGGFVFSAKPVENARDGEFLVAISQNPKSKIKLIHGSYRVPVSFEFSYTRKDECQSGVTCLLGINRTNTVTKTLVKQATFYISRHNNFENAQKVSLGKLLVEGKNYKSELVKVTMLVKDAVFALN